MHAMQRFLPVALIAAFATLVSASDDASFEFPPEWTPQAAVWIDFVDQSEWFTSDHPARIEVIGALVDHVPVKVLVDNEVARDQLDDLLADAGIDRSNITVLEHPIPNTFIRDAGPLFLTDGESLKIADFGWDCYADAAFCREIDYRRGEVANDLAERFGWPVVSGEIDAEGGALEVTDDVILAYADFATSRNPDLSLDEVARVLLGTYGKEKMIWIDESPLLEKNGHKIANYYGQGANGHIDTTMRFVDNDTVLVAVMDEAEKDKGPLQARDYEILQRGLEQIRTARNADGERFEVIEIPVPDVSLHAHPVQVTPSNAQFFSEHDAGDTVRYVPAMGYANFLITNGAVLVSEYWQEGMPDSLREKDERMQEILAEQFPDRKIIPLKKSLLLNWNGGGIHCATQQEPALN